MAATVYSKVLKCNFALDEDGENKFTLSIKDPKDDLTLTAVSSVMDNAVTNNIFKVNGDNPTAFLDAYIETTTRQYLT